MSGTFAGAWRDGLAWRWRVLAAQFDGSQRERGVALARWRAMWGWGGVAFEAELAEVAGAPRLARLTLQPDGDVLLCLPRGFGQRVDDEARLGALLADVPGQLQAMWLAAQSGRMGAVLVLGEAAMAGGAVLVPLQQGAAMMGWLLAGGAFPWGGVVWAAGAVALPVALRGGMRQMRGVLLRRLGAGGSAG